MLPLVPGPERGSLVPAARLPAALDQGAVDQLLQPGGGRLPCLQQVSWESCKGGNRISRNTMEYLKKAPIIVPLVKAPTY